MFRKPTYACSQWYDILDFFSAGGSGTVEEDGGDVDEHENASRFALRQVASNFEQTLAGHSVFNIQPRSWPTVLSLSPMTKFTPPGAVSSFFIVMV
jgi:hypothetical protein